MLLVKNKWTCISLVLCLASLSFADTDAVSPKVGLHAGIGGVTLFIPDTDVESMAGITVSLAVAGWIPLGSSSTFAFRPDVAFEFVNIYTDENESIGLGGVTITEDEDKVNAYDMNILINPWFRISLNRLFFDVGPSFNINLSDSWEMGDLEIDNQRNFTWGPAFGLGFKVNEHFELDAHLQSWVADVYDSDFMGNSFSIQEYVGLGVWF